MRKPQQGASSGASIIQEPSANTSSPAKRPFASLSRGSARKIYKLKSKSIKEQQCSKPASSNQNSHRPEERQVLNEQNNSQGEVNDDSGGEEDQVT